MDCIDLFKKAAAAMQTDPRYLELDAARRENDNDQELQGLIGEFNLKRLDLNNESAKPEPDTAHVAELNQQLQATLVDDHQAGGAVADLAGAGGRADAAFGDQLDADVIREIRDFGVFAEGDEPPHRLLIGRDRGAIRLGQGALLGNAAMSRHSFMASSSSAIMKRMSSDVLRNW